MAPPFEQERSSDERDAKISFSLDAIGLTTHPGWASQQVYCMFSWESRTKPLFDTGILGGGLMRTILLINLSLFGILCSKMACLLDDKGEQLLQNRRFRVYQLGVKLKTSPSSHVKPLNLKIYQRPTDVHFNIQLRFSTNFLRLTQQILEKHPPQKMGEKNNHQPTNPYGYWQNQPC